MRRPDLVAVRALVARDLRAVSRSKAVTIPMVVLPVVLLVLLPGAAGLAARHVAVTELDAMLATLPAAVAEPIVGLPPREQLVVLVNGYLLAPLFLIVPVMVASVLAADAFAGEKERRTLETLLHLPLDHRDLFLAKLLGAFLPAVALSWAGFVAFAVVANATAWPLLGRLLVPTWLWAVVIGWVGPGVAALGLGVMVRVSARVRTAQEANQLGGAVVLPVVLVAVGQSSGLLLVTVPVALGIGAVVWALAGWLVVRGAQRFTADHLASGA